MIEVQRILRMLLILAIVVIVAIAIGNVVESMHHEKTTYGHCINRALDSGRSLDSCD